MKITGIKQQLKQTGRYSIYVEGKYVFSLSSESLLDSKLVSGQELSEQQIREYKQLSSDDKLYNLTLRYVAIRPRSAWELQNYLDRKQAPPALAIKILNKLSDIGLINDEAFAQAYVNDRRLLRPTSRRKITLELRKKHVADEIIQTTLGNEQDTDQAALQDIIRRKRSQSRYQDDLKLMQYLSRQGFNYGDIKSALETDKQS
ncbi:MAG: RecX family transcriptional regulator [Patescibacteria group bacterium]